MEKGSRFEKIYQVNDAVYEGFIAVFLDNNPLHTDDSFAKSKGFKSKVMHGNILNGFISHFVGECLPTKDVIIHSQGIKYYNPIYKNDSLKLSVVVDDFFESVQTIEFKFIFENQNKLKIAKGNISVGII